MSLQATTSQTAGPYLHIGFTADERGSGTGRGGERVSLSGRVLDADGAPVDDAMLEVWQADPQGRYAHPEGGRAPLSGFRGWGRVGTDEAGWFRFTTVKRRRAGAGREPAGTTHGGRAVHARHPEAARDTGLLPRRARQPDRPGAGACPARAPRYAGGAGRRAWSAAVERGAAGPGRDGVLRFLTSSALLRQAPVHCVIGKHLRSTAIPGRMRHGKGVPSPCDARALRGLRHGCTAARERFLCRQGLGGLAAATYCLARGARGRWLAGGAGRLGRGLACGRFFLGRPCTGQVEPALCRQSSIREASSGARE